MAQMQLLPGRLAPNDAIFTPEWCAKDMIEFFNPTGRILEPCAGNGAFLNNLPDGTEWCEIDKGRDFFAWNEQVDWIISNPPYSLFKPWIIHSFEVAKNIAYLVPLRYFFTAYGMLSEINKHGWLKHVRIYGTGSRLKFPSGNATGALLFQRDYWGDTSWSWYAPNNGVHGRLATVAQDGQSLRTV